MKKNFLILFTLMFVSFIGFGLLSADIEDPTGTADALLQLQDQHRAAVTEVANNIQLDFHPVYGHVDLRALPVNPDGWDESQVASLFPGETVVSYEIQETTITGIALIDHMAEDGTIFSVWHRVQDEPSVMVRAMLMGHQHPSYHIVLYRCINGYNLIMDDWGNIYWVKRDPFDWYR